MAQRSHDAASRLANRHPGLPPGSAARRASLSLPSPHAGFLSRAPQRNHNARKTRGDSEMPENASEKRLKLRERMSLLARELARREQHQTGHPLKVVRHAVARTLGISDTRFKDILYGDARRIEPHEAEAIESATQRIARIREEVLQNTESAKLISHDAIKGEIEALRRRLADLESLIGGNHEHQGRGIAGGDDGRSTQALRREVRERSASHPR